MATEETKSAHIGRQHNLFAISVRQPFADLIVSGIKPVDNRTYKLNLTGVILIHASKTLEPNWEEMLSSKARVIANKHVSRLRIGSLGFNPFPLGAIVGAAIIDHTDDFYSSNWCMRDHYYVWLTNPVKFSKPIQCTGYLKIFRPAIMLNQFPARDRAELNRLYSISTALGLQKLPITNFQEFSS